MSNFRREILEKHLNMPRKSRESDDDVYRLEKEEESESDSEILADTDYSPKMDLKTEEIATIFQSWDLVFSEMVSTEIERKMKDRRDDHCAIISNDRPGDAKEELVMPKQASINWLHFRNYRHSPFSPTPKNLKMALRRWRAFTAKPRVFTEPGKEKIDYCYICGRKIDGPEHRLEKDHIDRIRDLDLSEFDSVSSPL